MLIDVCTQQLNGFNHVFRRKVIYTVGAIDCKVHSYVNVVLQRISIPHVSLISSTNSLTTTGHV